MRRLLGQRLLVRWTRSAVSLGTLVQTQNALKKGQSISATAGADFARFCGLSQASSPAASAAGSNTDSGNAKGHKSTKKGKGGKTTSAHTKTTSSAQAEFARALEALKAEEESRPMRGASSDATTTHLTMDLPVFLAYFHKGKDHFTLYSVTHDKLLASDGAAKASGGGVWELADEVIGLTQGAQQFILLPVIESEKDRNALAAPLQSLSGQMRACGLQPVTHVDTLELSTALAKSLPSFRRLVAEVTGATEARVDKLTVASLEWFRARWVYLRTLACKSSEGDPIHTISTLILPRYSLFVVHLVRAGSRSMNISLYEPARRRRFSSKGMLSDILACLLEVQAKRMILVPTNRTDRALLYRCRTAIQKVGNECAIAFASEVDERYRKAYSSDPARYWGSMKEVTKTLDADLLFQFYLATGNDIREYRKKVVHTTEVGQRSDKADATGGQGAEAAEENAVVSQSNVEAWLKQFRLPARLKAERDEVAHYQKYLVISYTAGNVLDRGQPSNPLSPLNFIIAACLQDATGQVLEPWAKFTTRGEFALPSLDAYEVLVLYDAKQFLVHQWRDKELQRFLQRGGRVWCTMLAEYLLSAQRQRTGHLQLEAIALRYGHLLPPQTKLGTSNDQLPLAFLRQHLVPAAPALVTVFQEQVRASLQRTQLVSLAHRMDSLLAMAAMEVAGIFIDMQEADRQSKTWKTAAVTLDRALDAYTPMEIPVDMQRYFDWHSLTHMHAYLFGGTISIGQGNRARHSAQWTSNLIHLCHAYGPFAQMVGEVYLQQFASQSRLSFQGSTKLPNAISQYITSHGTDKLKKYRVVLFDVETTGLNVFTDEIIEVAFHDPVEKRSFTSLVRPGRRITPRTTDIHHITDAMVRDAPPMETVAAEITKFLRLNPEDADPHEITLLIGHNVFGLDEPMLRRALDRHCPDAEHDKLLYCDSIVLLQALRQELSSPSSSSRRKVDKNLLDVLTSTLKLGDLVERLGVRPDGPMHRAETDTKALWFVLLAALGLNGKSVEAQKAAILSEAARSLLTYPAAGCFIPTSRKTTTLQVRLPGIAHEAIANTKTVKQLAAKPISDATLKILHEHGVGVAGLLLQRQRLQQDAMSFLQPSSDGAMTAVHADHAVHQHIDMTATTTTRTTSLYPSCQNIPKDDKSSVRRLFVSRFGAKGRCVEVDYSQLEIVVLAILCRDAHLTKDLNGGVDFHIKRAAFFSGLPYTEIAEGYQRRVPKYVTLRKTAKQFSFQRLYGAGVPLLHKTTGIPPKDLEASIAAENTEYPGIALFHQLIRSVALRPNNPGLPTGLIAEMPTGLQLNFRARDVVLNLPPMKNYPIQGYGAELAQIMLGRLMRHFIDTRFYGDRAYLINFVHDSVWLDCHEDVLSEVMADTCRILSDVHRYVPQAFPGVTIDVPLHVSASCGVNMCAMGDLDAARAAPSPSGKKTMKGNKATKATKAASRKTNKASKRAHDEDEDDHDDGDDDAVSRLLQSVDVSLSQDALDGVDDPDDNTPVLVQL